MAKARSGQRVADGNGRTGTVYKTVSFVAHVRWDDGTMTKVPASSIYKIGGPRWPVYVAIALLLLGLIIVAGVLLSSTGR